MNYLIKTKKSFLKSNKFNNIELLKNTVSEVDLNLTKNPSIIVFGKKCKQHRSIGFFSNQSIGYFYSGQILKSIPLSKYTTELLKQVNLIYKSDFNGILVNKYIDGNDKIGAHSDNEDNLDKIGVVAISYGTSRKFRIRDKKTKKIVKDIIMNHGDIIHMGGNFQQEFTHEIPVEKKIKSCRYSFTFRKHLE